ncbi:MAG TPA: NAD(P)/FAD-dependent oxidoreductase [Rhizomicrobium sp.]|jgi:phytoene dehydrogenase-like protein|nr:NAD(P)/FAD-dependent oxidoreductase [Rhizomicrobium sp.]
MAPDVDIVIIGGGHNGLVCAFYLARAGLRVTVLERREIVGGAAVTEVFAPGFRNSTASYTVSLLHPKIIAEMSLAQHGLRIVARRLQNFLPLNDRDYLATGPGRTKAEVAKFSARDAARLDEFTSRLGAVADAVRGTLLTTPPKLIETRWTDALAELVAAGSLARRLGKLGTVAQRDLLELFGRSAGDILDEWFESDPVKAVFGFDAIVGNYASPYGPGTAYVLLHHALGEVNGVRGSWGHAMGGMGAITQAMAAACRGAGVDIRTRAEVREVVLESGRAAGVVTASGETFRARAVASNLSPKLLFGRLVAPELLPPDFRARIGNYRCASATFRMNVALSALPRFSCLPEAGDHLTAGIIIAPSLAYMDRAHADARALGWSKSPIVEMLIPSVVDDSLAPAGCQVASLFCQHVAPELPDGTSWDARKDEVADLMIETVERYAPGFRQSVIARSALSPLDLERILGLVGGDIMHGTLSLDQLFSARPVLGHGNYRSPIPGLYMCGSGTHPGGGVSGMPGHNAAREILKDRRRRVFGRPRY